MTKAKDKEADQARYYNAMEAAIGGDYDRLEVVENTQGDLMLPTTIKRRKADGKLEETPIMLKVLQPGQRFESKKRARSWLKDIGLDEEKDDEFFQELVAFEELAFAIRDREAPYDQHVKDARGLMGLYGSAKGLTALYTQLDTFTSTTDPRFGELDADQCWKVAERIANHGHAGPLADIAGFEQGTCILFMARQALKSRIVKPCGASSETSKAD